MDNISIHTKLKKLFNISRFSIVRITYGLPGLFIITEIPMTEYTIICPINGNGGMIINARKKNKRVSQRVNIREHLYISIKVGSLMI